MLGLESGAVEGDARLARLPCGNGSACNGQGVRLSHKGSDEALQLFFTFFKFVDLSIDGFELDSLLNNFI